MQTRITPRQTVAHASTSPWDFTTLMVILTHVLGMLPVLLDAANTVMDMLTLGLQPIWPVAPVAEELRSRLGRLVQQQTQLR